jgi:hypothetical protein
LSKLAVNNDKWVDAVARIDGGLVDLGGTPSIREPRAKASERAAHPFAERVAAIVALLPPDRNQPPH